VHVRNRLSLLEHNVAQVMRDFVGVLQEAFAIILREL
jgi:hypothetical protein